MSNIGTSVKKNCSTVLLQATIPECAVTLCGRSNQPPQHCLLLERYPCKREGLALLLFCYEVNDASMPTKKAQELVLPGPIYVPVILQGLRREPGGRCLINEGRRG